jgi:hypothetical protein
MERLRDFAIYLIAVPVLGILMGGVYSMPAGRATKGRDLSASAKCMP